MIISAFFQQLLMFALLHNLAVLDHQNQVCLTDGGKTVCNQEGGPALEQVEGSVLNQLLGLGVD